MRNLHVFEMLGLLTVAGLAAAVPNARAQELKARTSTPAASAVTRPPTAARLEKAAADVAAAALAYRAALERLMPVYEREVTRRMELSELRDDLYDRGVLSRSEYEDGQRALVEAQKNVEDTRRAIVEADRMAIEARVAEALARLAPLERGGYYEGAGLARYNGSGRWVLSEDTSRLQQFFMSRFGRPLPVSAYGQTPLHTRMGFDHNSALDVAVHPDSPEGRAIMEYLRTAGIPFIAAWGAVQGAASGAHIHVGQPSPRFTVGR